MCWKDRLFYFIIFIFIFTLFTVDLKLLIYTHKKSLYSLYSNNIELIDVNSVTEQEIQPFPKESLKSMRTDWQTYTYLFTHWWKKHSKECLHSTYVSNWPYRICLHCEQWHFRRTFYKMKNISKNITDRY